MGLAYLSWFNWYTVPSPIFSMVVWYCTPPHVLYVCGCGQVEIANRQAVTREADDHKGLWEQEVLSRSKLGLRVSLAWRCHCSSLFVLSSFCVSPLPCYYIFLLHFLFCSVYFWYQFAKTHWLLPYPFCFSFPFT